MVDQKHNPSDPPSAQDFIQFAQTPPENISARVLKNIEMEIQKFENPSLSTMLSRLGLLHFAASALTLSFCPQFGFNPFLDGHGITHYFMQFGEMVCLFLCGLIYLGMTGLAYRLFLTKGEWRRYQEHELSTYLGLAGMSLIFFAMAGPEFSLALGASWAVGALLAFLLINRLPIRRIAWT